MSVSEDSVSCLTKNSVNVNSLDSPSVSDAKTVLKNTNVHSCHVEEAEPQNDGEFLKGLLTDTFCQVCEAVLMFESQRVSHYEGKKHAQRVRIYLQTKKAERDKQCCESSSSFQNVATDPEKFCALCNMVFSSPTVAKSHYTGKVHAKNTRKSSIASSLDARTTMSPVAPPVETVTVTAESTQGDAVLKAKEIPASATHKVDLSDPDKYCKLCTASFNNPTMASEHYGGRKHQRNLARQEQQTKLEEQSKHANSLTCSLCSVTLSSIDTYQAHMKANKHNVKETKQEDLSKKKVYNSFQDELADYIQVQRSRGLEPKTGQLSESQGPQTASLQSHPIHLIPAQPWCPPFHSQANPATFKKRLPVPNQWDQGYSSYPPPLIPGLTGRALRRGRSPASLSFSSSLSDSSSSYSSSSEDRRDRRFRKKKRREGIKKQKTEENLQRSRREKRKENPRRQQETSDEDHVKLRKEKKHKEKVTKKRPRDEDEGGWTKVSHVDMIKEEKKGEAQSEEVKEEKKHKKERKKLKDRKDNRTEEEKLWDATILGSF